MSAQTPIAVLLVTGQSNRYHNWAVSSVIIKRQLEATGRFAVTVATTPPKGTTPNQDMSSFTPDFAAADTNLSAVTAILDGAPFTSSDSPLAWTVSTSSR